MGYVTLAPSSPSLTQKELIPQPQSWRQPWLSRDPCTPSLVAKNPLKLPALDRGQGLQLTLGEGFQSNPGGEAQTPQDPLQNQPPTPRPHQA